MSEDLIRIQATAIDAGAAVASVSDSEAGGISVFLGTTRAEIGEGNRKLLALDYEAYVEMAAGQMRELAGEARRKWPIRKIVMLHRVGRVEVGAPSVIIAVSSPHRGQAFEACRFLIDGLKKQATIWKKEVWSDGSKSWVNPA